MRNKLSLMVSCALAFSAVPAFSQDYKTSIDTPKYNAVVNPQQTLDQTFDRNGIHFQILSGKLETRQVCDLMYNYSDDDSHLFRAVTVRGEDCKSSSYRSPNGILINASNFRLQTLGRKLEKTSALDFSCVQDGLAALDSILDKGNRAFLKEIGIDVIRVKLVDNSTNSTTDSALTYGISITDDPIMTLSAAITSDGKCVLPSADELKKQVSGWRTEYAVHKSKPNYFQAVMKSAEAISGKIKNAPSYEHNFAADDARGAVKAVPSTEQTPAKVMAKTGKADAS